MAKERRRRCSCTYEHHRHAAVKRPWWPWVNSGANTGAIIDEIATQSDGNGASWSFHAEEIDQVNEQAAD